MLEPNDTGPLSAAPDPHAPYDFGPDASAFAALLGEARAGAAGSAQAAPPVVFGREAQDSTDISPDDIHQYQLGDCFLDSSMGELALQAPDAVRDMIHDNGDGTYTVTLHHRASGLQRLFGSGYTTQRFTVTPNVPGGAVNQQSPDPVRVNGAHELWPQLIEAAYAAQNGGYAAISRGGLPDQAMESLTGHDARNIGIAQYGFDRLRADLGSGKLVVLATQPGLRGSPLGLVADHAYMVVGAGTDAQGRQLVTLRNPWGTATSGTAPVTVIAPYDQIRASMMYASVGSVH